MERLPAVWFDCLCFLISCVIGGMGFAFCRIRACAGNVGYWGLEVTYFSRFECTGVTGDSDGRCRCNMQLDCVCEGST